VVKVYHLKNITKVWLCFLPLLRRVSEDTSCVLLHGVSSCDIGCYNIIGYGLSKMIKWNELHS
jgi:hypothetical protein